MDDKLKQLLDEHGQTYAEQAGIRLADKPSPLYRLLVLTVLLSHPIQADVAVAAAVELSKAGMRTPRKMLEASWQDRVDALGRGHYVRYDESTATALGEGAQFLLDEYSGDVRNMRGDGLSKRLEQVPRIGPTGADIFRREAQAVWPELRPFFDDRALKGARKAKLPADPDRLGQLVPAKDHAKLAAALVRLALDH